MKIKPQHFKAMQEGINKVIETYPHAYEQYQLKGRSNIRYNWDMLRASTIEGIPGIQWICDNLYPYLNDEHIETALRNITGNK